MLENLYNELNLTIKKDEIDHAHRIGPKYKVDGETCQSIIVKFSNWEAKKKFYLARPRAFVNGKKKPGKLPFTVTPDLTKRRYNLLKKAKGLAADKGNNIIFAFTDINCNLAIKLKNNSIAYFDNDLDLNNLTGNKVDD